MPWLGVVGCLSKTMGFSVAESLTWSIRSSPSIVVNGGSRLCYAEIADAWKLVDAIRKVGGWPEYVHRRRATLGIWVIRKLPTVIEVEIAAFVEPPGGYY